MGEEAAHRETRQQQHPRDEGRLLASVARAEQRQQHGQRRQDHHQERDAVDGHVVGQAEGRRQHVSGGEVERLGPGDVVVVEERDDERERQLDDRGADRHGVGAAVDLSGQRGPDRPDQRDDEQEGEPHRRVHA